MDADRRKERISRTQRDRYECERRSAANLRDRLHAFALWYSPVWDSDNEDDVAAALAAVDEFLALTKGASDARSS